MCSFRMRWGEMFYSDSGGQGTPLVFLHGAGCDSQDWDGVTRLLPAGLRILKLDFRGHGKSDIPKEGFTLADLADDVLALADRLAIRQMVLVGHSLGGMAALDAAARSAQVAGLVLLEGWTSLQAMRAFAGQRFYGALDRSAIETIRKKSAKTLNRFDPVVWQHFWASVETFDASSFLKGVGIPVYEAYGEMGRTGLTRKMLMIPDNPHIRMVWIAGAGHYLPHERPREVAEVCREVLGEHESVK